MTDFCISCSSASCSLKHKVVGTKTNPSVKPKCRKLHIILTIKTQTLRHPYHKNSNKPHLNYQCICITHTYTHTNKQTNRQTNRTNKQIRTHTFLSLSLTDSFTSLLMQRFLYFISFHFISFHFISFHFISFHFISFHFKFRFFSVDSFSSGNEEHFKLFVPVLVQIFKKNSFAD